MVSFDGFFLLLMLYCKLYVLYNIYLLYLFVFYLFNCMFLVDLFYSNFVSLCVISFC